MLFEQTVLAPEVTDSYKFGHMAQYPEDTTLILMANVERDFKSVFDNGDVVSKTNFIPSAY